MLDGQNPAGDKERKHSEHGKGRYQTFLPWVVVVFFSSSSPRLSTWLLHNPKKTPFLHRLELWYVPADSRKAGILLLPASSVCFTVNLKKEREKKVSCLRALRASCELACFSPT
jgi:uncharacterized membrane protein YbaN (DUF454 family)